MGVQSSSYLEAEFTPLSFVLSLLEKVLSNTAALSSYEEIHVVRVVISFRGLQTQRSRVCTKGMKSKASEGEVLPVMCVQSMGRLAGSGQE